MRVRQSSLVCSIQPRVYAAGALIYDEGSAGSEMIFISSGSVALSKAGTELYTLVRGTW